MDVVVKERGSCVKLPLENPKPDIDRFIRVIKGEEIPKKPPFVELFLDGEVYREIAVNFLDREWVEPRDRGSLKAYWDNIVYVQYKMGYDYVRVSGGLDFPGKSRIGEDTAGELSRGKRVWVEEGVGVISSWEDYEKYPWPDPQKADLSAYEHVANNLPEGMGIFVCPSSGFLEIPLDTLLGYENLAFLLYDNPELVEAVFDRVGNILYKFYQQLIGLPHLVGFFQGDDMGFKTSTMISPNDLRKYSLPWHKKLANLAHENGLIYMLHSCGNIDSIMDDLIYDVKIDAKHSFEDEATSVIEFKQKYGDKIGVLGGIDMDKLCRLEENDLRAYVRNVLDRCMPGGRYALGSGNTVANYVPLKNYFIMLDEGLKWGD